MKKKSTRNKKGFLGCRKIIKISLIKSINQSIKYIPSKLVANFSLVHLSYVYCFMFLAEL